MTTLSSRRVTAAAVLTMCVATPVAARAQTLSAIGPVDLTAETAASGATIGDDQPTAVQTSSGVWVVWLRNPTVTGPPTVYAQLVTSTGMLPYTKIYTPDAGTAFSHTSVAAATAVDDAVIAFVASPPSTADVGDPSGAWRIGVIDFGLSATAMPMVANLGTFSIGSGGGAPPVISAIALPQWSGGIPAAGATVDLGFGLIFSGVRAGSAFTETVLYDVNVRYPVSSGTPVLSSGVDAGGWDTLRATRPRAGVLTYLAFDSRTGGYVYSHSSGMALATGSYPGEESQPGFASLDALQSVGFTGRIPADPAGTVHVMPLSETGAAAALSVPALPFSADQIAASLDTGETSGAWISATSDAHGVVAATYTQSGSITPMTLTLTAPSTVMTLGSFTCAQPTVSAITDESAVVAAACGPSIGTSSHVVAWVVTRTPRVLPDAGVDVITPPEDVPVVGNDTGGDGGSNIGDAGMDVANDDAGTGVEDAPTTPPMDVSVGDVYQPPAIAYSGGACNCRAAGTPLETRAMGWGVVVVAAAAIRRRRRS